MASNAQDHHAPLKVDGKSKDEDDEEDCKYSHSFVEEKNENHAWVLV